MYSGCHVLGATITKVRSIPGNVFITETAKRLPPHPVGEAGQIQEKGLWSQAVLWQAKEHENKQVKLKISSIS